MKGVRVAIVGAAVALTVAGCGESDARLAERPNSTEAPVAQTTTSTPPPSIDSLLATVEPTFATAETPEVEQQARDGLADLGLPEGFIVDLAVREVSSGSIPLGSVQVIRFGDAARTGDIIDFFRGLAKGVDGEPTPVKIGDQDATLVEGPTFVTLSRVSGKTIVIVGTQDRESAEQIGAMIFPAF